MEFSSITLQFTSIHMDRDKYRRIQTRPKAFFTGMEKVYIAAWTGLGSWDLFPSGELPFAISKRDNNIQWAQIILYDRV